MTDLTGGRILRTVLGFSLPLTAANFLQQSYLLVDSVVVGRYVGVQGLAAVGVAQPLFYLANGAFIGLSTGFSILIARRAGARTRRGMADGAAALAAVTAAWSLLCAGLLGPLSAPLLGAMGVHGALAHESRTFLLTLCAGFPALFGVAAVCAFLRGLGDSKRPMRLMIGSSVANAAMVWLFVGGLRLGIAGAALATDVVSVATLAVGLWYAARSFRLSRHEDGRDQLQERVSREGMRREARAAVGLGFPVAVQHVLLALGIMVLVWIVTPLGAPLIAALTVAGRLEYFASVVFLDFSGALTVFVAQNLGADLHERIRRGVRQVVVLTAVLTVAISAVVTVFGQRTGALFTTDPQVRHLIAQYIVITYPFFVLYTVMAVIHGFFNGAGRTWIPLVCTVLSFLVVRLPLSYALRRHYGADGVIWAVDIGWLAGFVYTLWAARQLLGFSPPTSAPPTGSAIPVSAGAGPDPVRTRS